MSKSIEKKYGLSSIEAKVVEWQQGDLNKFDEVLWILLSVSSSHNLDRLKMHFPDHVAGFRLFHEEPGWWGLLEQKIENYEDQFPKEEFHEEGWGGLFAENDSGVKDSGVKDSDFVNLDHPDKL